MLRLLVEDEYDGIKIQKIRAKSASDLCSSVALVNDFLTGFFGRFLITVNIIFRLLIISKIFVDSCLIRQKNIQFQACSKM